MLDALLDSKFFIGIIMIAMNLWGRHIVDEISSNEVEYRRNIVLRRVAIFALCYSATRDLITSIALTAGFVVLAMGVSRRGQEGMANPEPQPDPLRTAAGLTQPVEQPAYDTTARLLFNN